MSRFGTRFRLGQPLLAWMHPGRIRRIQRGTVTIAGGAATGTATILAVDTANTRLVWMGHSSTGNQQDDNGYARIALTNATTVTATRAATPAGTCTVAFEVVEYQPGVIRLVQRDTITVNSSAVDKTIQMVDVSRATVDYLGFSYNATTSDLTVQPRLSLLNATTVRAEVFSTTPVVGFQVVEWA